MELSYASKKIKSKKILNVFKLIFVVLLDFIIVSAIYILFYLLINPYVKLIVDNNSLLVSILIALLVAVISSIIAVFVKAYKLNKEYLSFYNKLLKEEAMLDGLALFENKMPFNDVEKKIIEDYVGVNNLIIKNGLTQTSSTAYFDIYQTYYGNHSPAVLIKTKIAFIIKGMIIIRDDNRKGLLSYEDVSLKQYGFGTSDGFATNNGFAIYTTIGNKIYNYIEKGMVEQLIEFGKFVRSPLTLTLFDDNLFIFIDGWKLNIEKSLFNKEGIAIIDAQIEALKKLQNYIENMTLLIKTNREEW